MNLPKTDGGYKNRPAIIYYEDDKCIKIVPTTTKLNVAKKLSPHFYEINPNKNPDLLTTRLNHCYALTDHTYEIKKDLLFESKFANSDYVSFKGSVKDNILKEIYTMIKNSTEKNKLLSDLRILEEPKRSFLNKIINKSKKDS